MAGYAKPLHLRLFLEGVEVPVIAASVTINPNAPAAASIQIVPVDEGMDLKPRTMVHLFFLDQYNVLPTPSSATDDRTNTAFLKNYKLLYGGEVVGFTATQSATSRGLILQCLDFSSYWDAATAEAIDFGPSGNAFVNNAAFYGADASVFDNIVNHQGERMMSWIRQKPLTPGLQTVSGLAGGIIRMLEAMGGVPNHHKGVNDFFTVAELRCKILEQIVAEEHDNTASNLLNLQVFDQWILNGLQNMGPHVTFRDLLKMLFSYIYYDVVPNPVAKYDPEVNTGPVQAKKTLIQLALNPKAIQAAKHLHDILDNCNRHAGSSGDNPDGAKTNAKALVNELNTVQSLLRAVGSAAKEPLNYTDKAKAALKRASEGSTGDVIDTGYVDATEPIATAIDILETSDAGSTSGTQYKTSSTSARLRTQIIRPDCFFSAPPTCNVIFPEQYSQLTYERTFIQEVTRNQIRIYSNLYNPEKDPLLADVVVAPNIGTDIKYVTKQEATGGLRALMPHEFHTGIIGRTEWLSNMVVWSQPATNQQSATQQRGARLKWASRAALFNFFKWRFGTRQASISGRFNPYLVCGFPAVIIRRPFIPDRSLETSQAIGNLTSDAILDKVQNSAQELGGPSQLVGMIGALQHNLDQTGGTTAASLHHMRSHLGVDDDFVGIFASVQKRKKVIRVILNAKKAATEQNSTQLEILANVTPQSSNGDKAKVSKKGTSKATVTSTSSSVVNGKVMAMQQVQTVEVSTETPINFNADSPIATKGRIEGLDRDNVLIPNPAGKLSVGGKGVYGTIKGIEVLPPFTTVTYNGKQAFTAVALYEELEVTGDFSVPIEEIVRPPWFSSSYSNDNIGQRIYQHFLGCDSIVDQVQFAVKGQQELPATVAGSNDISDISPDQPLADVIGKLAQQDATKGFTTVEKAINLIGYFYGLTKTKGLDVDRFIQAYSERPIATLVDILGTPDLQYSVSGGKATVTQGTAGFHSTATHPALVTPGNLTGLLEDPTLQLPRINNEGKNEAIPPEYDVRKEKRDRVLRYIQALMRSRGLLG